MYNTWYTLGNIWLTHLPLVPHIDSSVNRVSIGSGNGLSPVRGQAIIRNNADLLSIGPLGTNFSEIRMKIQNFSFMKMHLKMSPSKMATILSRGRWVNPLAPDEAISRPRAYSALVQVTAYCLLSTKLLLDPLLTYRWFDPCWTTLIFF